MKLLLSKVEEIASKDVRMLPVTRLKQGTYGSPNLVLQIDSSYLLGSK